MKARVEMIVFCVLIPFLMSAFCCTACNRGSKQETTLDTSLVTQEIRYRMPDAIEVLLAWGINGWVVLPEEMFSAETFVRNEVMHTPMQPVGDDFVVRIEVPKDTTIDYGFLITTDSSGAAVGLWDGDYQTIAAANDVVDIQSKFPRGSRETTIRKEPMVVEGFTLVPYSIQPEKYFTSLAFGPDGLLYVCSYDGVIWAIADLDGDGKGDEPQLYADGFEKPVGLVWHDQELYVASLGKITALRDQNSDGRVDETRDVVSNLPAGMHPVHANNDLIFGPDGRLYFGVGSTSNASPETYQYAASILSVNPDGSDLQIEATGVRNPYDMMFNATGDLFATDNGPDGEAASTFPPDELNHIVPGADYGFPHYFGPPEIGSGTLGPVLVLPVHSAPAGITFYYDNQFPPEYEGNAFVALWTRGQLYRVQFAQTTAGEYMAKGSVFASGLLGVVDVTVGPDGNLYVSTSESGTIYRISYDTP